MKNFNFRSFWSLFWALPVAVVLGGCASGVKLDEPAPVTDTIAKPVDANKTGLVTPTPSKQAASAAKGDSVATRDVTSVNTPPTPQPISPPQGTVKVVLFDYDSFVIRPEFQSAIEAHAKYLKANTTRKVALEGHTDERGGREYNLALGQRRAEAVASALRLLGVQDAQTEAVSFGKEKPAATGADESVWAKNRRAELFYK